MIASGHSSTDGITVFCGSCPGNDPAYMKAATDLGEAIAASGRVLVYGGGTKGLMGRVSAAALDAGGRVHGIIPTAFLSNEAPDRSASPTNPLERETTCNSMHERKLMMAAESQAFCALPGGFGTLEELAEATTWTQLGIHAKPVIVLNVNGIYDHLRLFVNRCIESGFIAEDNRAFMVFVDEDKSDPNFSWGKAALAAIAEWQQNGMGGAKPLPLEWPAEKRADLV